MQIFDKKILTFVMEPYEIVVNLFKESSSHSFNSVGIRLFRIRMMGLFMLLVVFKVITGNLRVVPQIINILLVGLLGIILIEALIRLFNCYSSMIEKNAFKGILKFMLIFIALIVVLGVF
jgi:hypothetical protein